MATLDVHPLRTASDRKSFVMLPWTIYAGDQHWVPPLLMDQKKTLKKDYPFFEHGNGELFIARRGKRIVGRISAQYDRRHLEKFNDQRGFFGWFECENDPEAAQALVNTARSWLADRALGFTHLRGPFQWNINGENTGVLVRDLIPGRPRVLMSYNPPWYPELLQSAGLTKLIDLFAYISTPSDIGRFLKLLDAIRRRLPSMQSRPLNMGSGYLSDMETVRVLYNSAWCENWGALDLSPNEMAVIAKGLKPIAQPQLTRICSVDGRPAGCIVCLPDINEILHGLNGRLLPLGWFKLLTGAKKLRHIRTMLMGVAPEFRGRGLEAVLIGEIIEDGLRMGCESSELSWILETNAPMLSLANKAGKLSRTYRVYEGII